MFAELMAAERLRPETAETMRSWQHSGFHVHASEPARPTDRKIARYDSRALLALDAM